MDVGDPIEYTITLNDEQPCRVTLRCLGTVLRSERDTSEALAVAATLERYEFVRFAE